METQSIRKSLRERRLQLNAKSRRQHQQAITRNLIRHPLFQKAKIIGIYIACKGEINPSSILAIAARRKKILCLPVLAPMKTKKLWFMAYRPGDALAPNRFRIPEPIIRGGKRISLHAIDLLLTPLVAFDKTGTRVGMGGGYYDRTFAYLAKRTTWKKPKLLGLGYSFQEVNNLTRNFWDIPIYGVVTEKNLQILCFK